MSSSASPCVCAETDEKAEYLAWTLDLTWLRLRTGRLGPLPSPEEAMAYPYTPFEREFVRDNRGLHFIGSPETVRRGIEDLVAETGADEVMVATTMHDPAERILMSSWPEPWGSAAPPSLTSSRSRDERHQPT